MAGAST